MDFFEAQARAKQRTTRLVVLFAFAVVGIILAGYFAAVTVSAQMPARMVRRGFVDYQPPAAQVDLWQPGLFFAITAGTLAVVGLASLYKWNEFSGGGASVAEGVGARRIEPGSANPHERQLLNVVEEMAIAAGLPVPGVYVLDDETGINAFAAGLTTGDAIVCVTRGTLEKLTRDELQGVIGHEFSHVLNGDMRLNLRLTAVLFGILVIGLAGRGIIWSLRNVRFSSRDSKNSGGIVLAIAVAGGLLFVLGYIGYFFGRLIQAAVSRQREFLADASSVQFTRNPGGITGALKKIGGYALGSDVIAHNTAQLNHFFFAQAFRSNFGGAWATHPPLDERIRAIDPKWSGKMFDPPEVVDIEQENFLNAGFAPGQPKGRAPAATDAQAQPAPLPRRLPFHPATLVADAGTLTTEHFRRAQQLLAALPAPLLAAARDPAQAPALVCALILNPDPALRTRQIDLVAQHAGDETVSALTALLSELENLSATASQPSGQPKIQIPNSKICPEARLPLLQLAVPTLRALDPATLDRLLTTLDELVHADAVVTPFEFAMQKVLYRQLGLAREPRVRIDYYAFQGVAQEIAVVLSVLARVGARDESAAAAAFATGAGQLPVIVGKLALLPPAASTLAVLDTALDKLAAAKTIIKQRLLVAAAQTIVADGVITAEEGELYRALAATLDVPMPLPAAG